MDQELHGRQQPPSTTTALACLDVLRGASVLVHQAEEALTELLALQQSDGGAVAKAASRGAAVASGWGAGALEEEKDGGAAGADMKRSQVEVAAGGGQQHQEVVHHTTGTYLPYVAGTWTPQTTPPPARRASSMVLTRFELLLQIMGYLGEGRGDTLTMQRQRVGPGVADVSNRAERAKLEKRRRALGEMSLVCRAWRDAAQHEGLWEPLAKELHPRLARSSVEQLVPRPFHDEGQVDTPTGARIKRARVGYREYLVEDGRLWVDRRVLSPHSRWDQRIVLQVEISDWADEFQYLHGEDVADTTTVGDGMTLATEPVGQFFSVTSRDFHRPQYRSMREYLEGLGSVGTRVVVRDKNTGRKALLWDTLRSTISSVELVDDGNFHRTTAPLSLTTVSYGPGSLDVVMSFYVDPQTEDDNPVPDSNMEGTKDDNALPDDQKLYQVASPRFEFETADALQVERLLWSALGY